MSITPYSRSGQSNHLDSTQPGLNQIVQGLKLLLSVAIVATIIVGPVALSTHGFRFTQDALFEKSLLAITGIAGGPFAVGGLLEIAIGCCNIWNALGYCKRQKALDKKLPVQEPKPVLQQIVDRQGSINATYTE